MIFQRRNLSRIAGLVSCGFAFSVMLAMNTGCVNSGGAVKGQGEVDVPLAKDGKPVASIVVAKEASRSAQFAAAELQCHIEKITGAKLPVVSDAEAVKGPRILVGASKATQALGLANGDFKHQEYLIRFLPDTLILMGKDKEDTARMDYAAPQTFPGLFDEQATCYAVYDFLERFCGVRWYLPTELGLVCPRQETLVVKGADVRRAPAMKYREMNEFANVPADLSDEPGPRLDGREGLLFAHRQRIGGQPYAANHSFYGYYRRFLKDHPEWFAKGYDKDMPEEVRKAKVFQYTGESYDYKGYPLFYYPNMCYTSTGFIQQVITSARNYFDTGKTLGGETAADNYFSLGIMDSTGQDKMCKCAECQKLIHNEPPCNKWRKQPFFWDDKNSDYIFGFVNQVAKEVGKTHPDKYLTMFAYHQTYYPPTREPLEPNVAITFCIHAQLRGVPAMDRAVNDLLNKWDEESRTRPKYLYLYFHRPGRANPFFPGFMAHNMVKQMEDYHKRGFRGIGGEPAYLHGEPGDARRSSIVNQLELYVAFKLADDPTLDGNKLINEFFTLYYGAAARPMQALYEAIERVYCDPANYAFDQNYNGYQTKEIAWGKLGTAEHMVEFGKLMAEAKNAAKTDTEKKRVALFEKSVWNRMQAGRAEYESTSAQGKNSLKSVCAALLTGAAPNGDLAKVDWSQARIMKNWGTLDGKPTSRQLEGRLLHDGQFLYVQLQEMMDTAKLVRRDDGIWDEDDWELFVARERGKGCRQMGVNAKGTHQELAYGEEKKTWDSGAKVASDTSAPDRWVVRMAFPLETLLPGSVKPGQTIYLNICRGNAGDAKKSLSWIPTFSDSFHSLTQLGEVKLADKSGINTVERTEGE